MILFNHLESANFFYIGFCSTRSNILCFRLHIFIYIAFSWNNNIIHILQIWDWCFCIFWLFTYILMLFYIWPVYHIKSNKKFIPDSVYSFSFYIYLFYLYSISVISISYHFSHELRNVIGQELQWRHKKLGFQYLNIKILSFLFLFMSKTSFIVFYRCVITSTSDTTAPRLQLRL